MYYKYILLLAQRCFSRDSMFFLCSFLCTYHLFLIKFFKQSYKIPLNKIQTKASDNTPFFFFLETSLLKPPIFLTPPAQAVPQACPTYLGLHPSQPGNSLWLSPVWDLNPKSFFSIYFFFWLSLLRSVHGKYMFFRPCLSEIVFVIPYDHTQLTVYRILG